MKTTSKRILGILLTLCLMMGMLALTPIVTSAANFTVTLEEYDPGLYPSVEAIRQEIQDIIYDDAAANGTITVVGELPNADKTLELNILADVTVIWQADYAGVAAANPLFKLTGKGAFVLDGGAVIDGGDKGIIASDGVKVTVNDAALTTTSAGIAIEVKNADAFVTGGEVTAAAQAINAVNVTVSGGAVTSTAGTAIKASDKITVSAGEVTGVAAALDADKDAAVSGGTVTGTTLAIKAVNVTVSGDAEVASEATAINATGNVAVSGGTVDGVGTVITTTGDIAVSGGTVNGTSGAVSGANISVSGTGAVNATDGTAIVASKDVNISGGAVNGTAGAITAVNVTVSGGSVAASGDTAKAIAASDNVNVSGGTVSGFTAVASASGDITVSGGEISGDTAISTDTGSLKIIGGKITGETAAIDITGAGVAVIVKGADITGDILSIDDTGMVVGVTPAANATLLGDLHGTEEGLEILSTSDVLTATWDCADGTSEIVLALTGGTKKIAWGTLLLPLLSNGSADRTSDTAAIIGFNSNVKGIAYAVAMYSGSVAPAKATVRSVGTKLGDVASGETGDIDFVLTIGAKDVYVVVEDAAGNISAPLKIIAPMYVIKYALTVTGGTGTGNYAAGQPVRVTATVPNGKVFDKWVSADAVAFENANAASTSITMLNKDTAVEATFKDAPPPAKYIFSTKYEQNTCNWLKFFLLFGWVWMWFFPPV